MSKTKNFVGNLGIFNFGINLSTGWFETKVGDEENQTVITDIISFSSFGNNDAILFSLTFLNVEVSLGWRYIKFGNGGDV